jgi:hypothetical protein
MGIGTRIFLVSDDDTLQHLSLARFERLRRQYPEERLPQYACKRVRYALVLLETEHRRPVGINLIQYSYLPFDSEGRLDAAEMEKAASLAVDIVPPLEKERQNGHVIDAHYRFAKKRYDDNYKWTPSPEIEEAIVEAIFAKKRR